MEMCGIMSVTILIKVGAKMKKKYSQGLVMDPETATLKPVKRGQYIQQWIYGFVEPAILKTTTFMYDSPIRTKLYNKLATPKSLPREVVVSTEAVCRFIDFIYTQNAGNESPRMAVTKCVCQTATNTFKEPVEKDMALLYTANLYSQLDVKRNGVGEPYRIIETAEEAKDMIRYFDECGLVHSILYCHSSGKWTFVVCNCDDEICVPIRAYKAGRRDQVLAGPEVVTQDASKCTGCGKCVSRCFFDANKMINGKAVLDAEKCLGCGLCASTCEGHARTLIPRPDYQHEDTVTTKILLG